MYRLEIDLPEVVTLLIGPVMQNLLLLLHLTLRPKYDHIILFV